MMQRGLKLLKNGVSSDRVAHEPADNKQFNRRGISLQEGALKGKAWKGIYALDGDTLTICDNAPNLNKGRPAAFDAKTGSGYVLITFKREASLS